MCWRSSSLPIQIKLTTLTVEVARCEHCRQRWLRHRTVLWKRRRNSTRDSPPEGNHANATESGWESCKGHRVRPHGDAASLHPAPLASLEYSKNQGLSFLLKPLQLNLRHARVRNHIPRVVDGGTLGLRPDIAHQNGPFEFRFQNRLENRSDNDEK